MTKAGEMVQLAEAFRERMKRNSAAGADGADKGEQL